MNDGLLLPSEILVLIFQMIPPNNLLLNCSLVCHQWTLLIGENSIWKAHYETTCNKIMEFKKSEYAIIICEENKLSEELTETKCNYQILFKKLSNYTIIELEIMEYYFYADTEKTITAGVLVNKCYGDSKFIERLMDYVSFFCSVPENCSVHPKFWIDKKGNLNKSVVKPINLKQCLKIYLTCDS